MKHGLSRRDFLKLAGLASLGMVVPPSVQHLASEMQGDKKNVLIVVFDALSAYNTSLHGYGRETTPNLTRLAKRAAVFHNHFAGGNFTTPGTASLLTGALPWTHRAIRFNDGVTDEFAGRSIFHAFDDYHRIAYSHNTLVNTLFEQFISGINEHVPQEDLFLFNDGFIRKVFGNDEDTATVGWARTVKRTEGYSYSLFLSQLYEAYRDNKVKDAAKLYPYGLPSVNNDNFFALDQGIDTLGRRLTELPQPFMGYFHFLPPHYPYKPSRDFAGAFTGDSFKPLSKPEDLFTEDRSDEFLNRQRLPYDEFILNADHEFARLFDMLESSGLLENTWLVLTSDHGELFERGIWAHATATLYQPVVRVPLLIFEPGVAAGKDVYSPTSAIDLMPTLLHLTGHEIPAWVEGSILPPYAPSLPAPGKGVFSVQARYNEPTFPITEVSVMHVQDNYKLVYYLGYEELGAQKERFLLYDIQSDPEELVDLAQTKRETAADLLRIVKQRLDQANEPYR
ncbi:MAG: hypothetical protein DPW18_17240 [Chloroflexi bacterium]|nr:hypothetical protein [Chloroflexota bacterium]MDL1940939.1 twin-arginine translocation signal domain-containing protein [Chloroflexi bacterium CFX2]